MNPIINITHTAGKQLLQIAKINKVKHILFSVTSGGCNGYNYKFTPIDKFEKNKLDEIVPYQDINIVVCSYSFFNILGTTIDWKMDIMGEAFHFENPNAVSQCGCGTSFSVKS
jgi:iron-sulfur cluster assembly accessory protein